MSARTLSVKVGPPDCFRRAVAAAYGLPQEGTPEVLPTSPDFERVWRDWALAHGYRWWFSSDVAPVHLRRWIASVPGLGDDGQSHAVVMEHDHLLLDPNADAEVLERRLPPRDDPLLSVGELRAYTKVNLAEVREAKWLERAGTDGIVAKFEPINDAPDPEPEVTTFLRGTEPRSMVKVVVDRPRSRRRRSAP